MIRDEEKQLHDLPETRGMTAREALTSVLRTTAEDLTPTLAAELADEVAEKLGRLGFAVLPAIPVPIGKEGR